MLRIQGVGVISKESLLSETHPLGSQAVLCLACLTKSLDLGESLIRSMSAGGYTPASGEMRKGDRERGAKMA